jgi:UDP-glucose 4-epimerase
MKIAVIGARGYVGQSLCRTLAAEGAEIVTYSAGPNGGISIETGLLPADFAFAQDIDAVYFLAQSPRYRQTPEQAAHLLSVNCVAAVQAAEAARHSGVRKFIYTSTGNVYAPSFQPLSEDAALQRGNWYSLSKIMAEDALALYSRHMDLTIGRIFGAYGPGQLDKLVPMIANSVRSGKAVFVDRHPNDEADDGGLRVSLLYIDDLVASLLKMLSISGVGTVNLAGEEPISIRRLANALASAYGTEAKLQLGEKTRAADLTADTRKFTRLFGASKVAFDEGIRRFVNFVPDSNQIEG